MNVVVVTPNLTLWRSDREAAELKYGHISQWDTSEVTDMSTLFSDMEDFNDNISQWNVDNVTKMNSISIIIDYYRNRQWI